ncbi:MAG: universal stress protein, partial [Bacteroidales bacterium]|nr:universal stress protein [Bacteroidales bacterium]
MEEQAKKKPILITWDFTQKAEFALAHGVNLCKELQTKMVMLHIAKNDKEARAAKKKMDVIAAATQNKNGVVTSAMAPVGNIFSTISDMAEEIHAELVIMGTHGMKGMQKLMGSWALKVISSSKIPFIVVQAPPATKGYKKIVFPVDFRSENKEKIQWIYYIGRLYNSMIYIIKERVTDRKFKKGIHSNLLYTEKFLRSNNLVYEIHSSPGKKDFTTETLDFAEQIEADLLLVTATRNIGLADYVLGANEQRIIANPS